MNLTTEYQVNWEESRFSITVSCYAQPITVERLVRKIYQALAKAGVYDASIWAFEIDGADSVSGAGSMGQS